MFEIHTFILPEDRILPDWNVKQYTEGKTVQQYRIEYYQIGM